MFPLFLHTHLPYPSCHVSRAGGDSRRPQLPEEKDPPSLQLQLGAQHPQECRQVWGRNLHLRQSRYYRYIRCSSWKNRTKRCIESDTVLTSFKQVWKERIFLEIWTGSPTRLCVELWISAAPWSCSCFRNMDSFPQVNHQKIEHNVVFRSEGMYHLNLEIRSTVRVSAGKCLTIWQPLFSLYWGYGSGQRNNVNHFSVISSYFCYLLLSIFPLCKKTLIFWNKLSPTENFAGWNQSTVSHKYEWKNYRFVWVVRVTLSILFFSLSLLCH